MSPGTTVTTAMPCRAGSAPIASDQPRSANFAASYGARCGIPTAAPIDVTFTIVPRRRARMRGSTASPALSAPQNMTSMRAPVVLEAHRLRRARPG